MDAPARDPHATSGGSLPTFTHGPADPPLAERVWSLPDAARVLLQPGVYRGPVAFPRDIEVIAERGLGSATIESVSGQTLSIEGAGRVRLEGLVLKGPSRGHGAVLAIHNPAEVEVVGCLLTGGKGTGYGGGGIDVQKGLLRVERCRFTRNRALRGGAIRAAGPVRVDVRNSLFAENTASRGGGGAIFVGESAEVEVVGCTFFGNSGRLARDVQVGGVRTGGGHASLGNCLFAGQDPGLAVTAEGHGRLELRHCVLPAVATPSPGTALGEGVVARRVEVATLGPHPFAPALPMQVEGLGDPELARDGELDLYGRERGGKLLGAVRW